MGNPPEFRIGLFAAVLAVVAFGASCGVRIPTTARWTRDGTFNNSVREPGRLGESAVPPEPPEEPPAPSASPEVQALLDETDKLTEKTDLDAAIAKAASATEVAERK